MSSLFGFNTSNEDGDEPTEWRVTFQEEDDENSNPSDHSSVPTLGSLEQPATTAAAPHHIMKTLDVPEHIHTKSIMPTPGLTPILPPPLSPVHYKHTPLGTVPAPPKPTI